MTVPKDADVAHIWPSRACRWKQTARAQNTLSSLSIPPMACATGSQERTCHQLCLVKPIWKTTKSPLMCAVVDSVKTRKAMTLMLCLRVDLCGCSLGRKDQVHCLLSVLQPPLDSNRNTRRNIALSVIACMHHL